MIYRLRWHLHELDSDLQIPARRLHRTKHGSGSSPFWPRRPTKPLPSWCVLLRNWLVPVLS